MTAVTNPLTYNAYITQIAMMAVVKTTTSSSVVVGVDQAFNDLTPSMLNYAELRIQRDLDLLPALTSRTYTLSSGVSTLSIPIDDFVTIESVAFSGVSSAPPLAVSKEFLQNVYGYGSTTGVPSFFAMTGGDRATYGTTSNVLTFGPTPDSNYGLTVYGVQRLQSLYAFANATYCANSYTFISQYLPDLLIQASMIYVSQYQRNFGAASNDPQMGPTFEAQYQTLLAGAVAEEARKKFQASAWSSMSQPKVATPGR